MKIILFTHNHVVKEFISLVADKLDAVLDIVEQASDADSTTYDYVFVDDKNELVLESKSLIDTGLHKHSILLYSGTTDNDEAFDAKIKKPFLPSEIQELIEQNQSTILDDSPLPNEQILNNDDIDEIKALLGGTGIDNTGEDIEKKKSKKASVKQQKNNNKTKSKKSNKNRKKAEKKLLKALFGLKKKEVKDILKGAKVTLKLQYMDED